jgi:D-alanyl-D-alanine carboxypeptidase (penicillin-binding protein 5/6)
MTSSRATTTWIAALAVAAGALALAAALLVPAGLPYDEPAHWANVLFYAENLRPPVLGDPGVTYQGQQTPLYYVLAAGLVGLFGETDAAFLAVRLFGAAGAVAVTLLTGALLRRSIPHRPIVIVVGTAFIALNPMFAVIAGSVQNDTWALVWAFALLWSALPFMDRAHAGRRPWAWGLLLGALASAAILTKLSLVPVVATVLALLLLRRRFVIALTAGAVVVAACGWWIVRNYVLYGDLTGQAGVERAGYEFGQGALGPLHLARSALTYLFLPTEYLRNSISAPWWIDGIVIALGLAVAVGGVLLAVRVRRDCAPGSLLLLVAVGAVAVAAWLIQGTFGWHVAFRTAYGVLPLVALAFGCATQAVRSRRGRIAVGVGLGMLLLVVGAWVAVVAPLESAPLTP